MRLETWNRQFANTSHKAGLSLDSGHDLGEASPVPIVVVLEKIHDFLMLEINQTLLNQLEIKELHSREIILIDLVRQRHQSQP